MNHRPSSISNHHNLTGYAHSDPYGSVKVEDENYVVSLGCVTVENYP